MNRTGFRSPRSRVESRNELDTSLDRIQMQTSALPKGMKPLSISEIRRRSLSPSKQVLSPRDQGNTSARNSISSIDGFTFKKRIVDSVISRMDDTQDTSRLSQRERKIFGSTQKSDVWGLRSTNVSSLRQSRSSFLKE